MKTNVGPADRALRVALGVAIGAVGIATQSWFGLIGLIPIGTAVIGWCPAYVPFGISTCKTTTEGSG